MDQDNLKLAQDDLHYIRNVIDKNADVSAPLASRIMWALYCLIGFVWLDIQPRLGSNFLLIGGLVCGCIDCAAIPWLNRRQGQQNRCLDRREQWQTVAFVLGGFVIWVLMIRGHFTPGYSPGQMFLVLIGYHLLTIGIQSQHHQIRWNGAIFLGLCLFAGSILLTFYTTGVWSVLGILSAIVILTGFQLPGRATAAPKA